MAQQFSVDNPPAAEARRLLLEQTARALRCLEDFERDPVRRVHDARRGFKRVRALLRLVKPVDAYVFCVEERFFRDLGRSLSAIRDQHVMVETADELIRRTQDDDVRRSLMLLRHGLAGIVDEDIAYQRSYQARVVEVIDRLRQALRRYGELSFDGLSRKVLRKRIRRALRLTRDAYRRACATDEPAKYHAWRKRVKYALNQIEMTAALFPEFASTNQRPLELLADTLGHHQDLTLLQTLLYDQHDALGVDDHLARLVGHVDALQAAAREQARNQGRLLFQRPDRDDDVVPIDQARRSA